VVVSKDPNGVANVRVLDEQNWYLLQTNDDHFDGVCLQRCVDGRANMDLIGKEGITTDRLLKEVLLQSHTFNQFTIYTTMASVSDNFFTGYGFDTDMPYVHQSAPTDMFFQQ